MTDNQNSRPAIAIVGVSALFPGSQNATGFWTDILAGKDLISDVPDTHWLPEDYYDPDPSAPDKTYARRGGFLGDIDFDAMSWGVPPSIIEATDTSQLLALIVAEAVLRDASGGQFDDMDRSRMSVILGVTSAQELLGTMVSRLQRPIWQKSLREHGLGEDDVQAVCQRISDHYVPWQESSFPGLLGNVVAGRIANRLDLGGTNCVTDAACASTFSALSMAVRELYLGDSDLVITGGVDTLNDIFMFMCFSKTPALSPSGDCRPFSDQADGTMLGEGLGMVALKRLDDAERDGNRIYAVITGVGSSSDGRSKSVYAPVPEGQAKALSRAYENAGYGPETVEMIEAHGTGTKAGDAAEFGGLSMVFDPGLREDRQWCALGSVKSQIGHTKAAAGAAGLFKTVMALHHKVLPPTIKVDQPNPSLNLADSAFHINTEPRPWIRNSAYPRRASVSSFGFGGSNFHIALQEYTGTGESAARLRSLPVELVALSGADGNEVAAAARSLAARAEGPGMLQRIAWESAHSFDPSAQARLAIVAASGCELAEKLGRIADIITADPTKPFDRPDGCSYGLGTSEGGVAFLFPGQGSQYLGMGGALAMSFDSARSAWDRSSDMRFGEAHRLDQVVFPISRFDDGSRAQDEDLLRSTEWAQPAIGTASLSLLGLLRDLGLSAEAVAGHSFGEVTALHAAGVLSEDNLLRVARRRGELMSAASRTPGSMSAVTAGIESVEAVLADLGRSDVVVANHNTPNQVVISGSTEGIAAAETALNAQGYRARRLQVSTAFHSPLVADSSAPFAEFLSDVAFEPGLLPVWSGESAARYEDHADARRARLAQQIARPVHFVALLDGLVQSGIHTFIEVGPGAVLTGLVGNCLAGRPHRAVALDRRGRHGIESLFRGLSQLAAEGVTLDLTGLWNGYAEPDDYSARKAPKLAVPISGANHGKLYPPKGGAANLPAPNLDVPAAAPVVAKPAAAPAAPVALPRAPAPIPHPAPSPTQPTVAPPMTAPSNPNATLPAGWLSAWQEAQHQNAAAHTAFQQAMAQSHTAFLHSMETTIAALAGLAGGQPIALAPAAPAPVALAPAHAVVVAPVQVAVAAPAPAVATALAAPAGATPPAPTADAPAVDLHALMLAVVSNKTGYPAEMLELEMDLEGDLGIDSIKRVEILAAVQDQAPGMPEVDASHMGTLKTLGEIVHYMQALMGSVAAPAATAPATPAAAAPAVDLHALMLAVVSNKTGYPAEMLELKMDLEGDLGIDSIKRVEILAAVQDQAPGMPEVDASHMGTLKTLGEIVHYMQDLMRTIADPAATAPAAPAAAAPKVDLHALMLAVVSNKTGYPAEMLELEMDLEGDLGIDSIKRVEILAAVQDQAPGMPEVDASHMGTLKTLGEIVHYMQDLMGSVATPAALAPAEPAAETVNLGRYALELSPSPAVGLAQPGLLGNGEVLITTGGGALADALVAELAGRGVTARCEDSVSADTAVVIFLGGLRAIADADAAIATQREAYAVARTIAASMTERGGLFVTVQDTGGAFATSDCAPERAWLAGLPALVKTASQEWPNAALKAIDLERAGRDDRALAVALADELLLGGGELEVGLKASGERLTPRAVPCEVQRGESPISKGDVVVVSGGARGVTAACVIRWAAECQGRFLLLGRSVLTDEPPCCQGIRDDAGLKRALLAQAQGEGTKLSPSDLSARVRTVLSGREIRATLAAVQAAGGEARYRSADVTDTESVSAVLAETRDDWGPVKALVHGAGVLADRLIADQTDDQFDRIFNTKIEGLRTLLAALASDPLAVLCMFSSVSARCGNNGQSTYAMANETLNKVAWAESRARGGKVLVKSLGWGPWEGGMVSPQLREHFAALGVPMIPLHIGAQMLADELSGSNPQQVELVLGGEPRPEALLVVGADARTLSLEVKLSHETHSYLAGHAIEGEVVVPVVLVLEWFSRIARAFRPDLKLESINDLKVLKGIMLPDFSGRGDRFVLSCADLSNGSGARLGLELSSPDGTLHYNASAQMVDARAPARSEVTLSPALDDWGGAPVYGDVLFHTDEFQVIQELEGVGDAGIAGTLHGVARANWNWESWNTDVAALDGGLQMLLLWARDRMGGAALPMAIGKTFVHAEQPPEGKITCVAHCRPSGSSRGLADVSFQDEAGTLFTEFKDVELIVRPGRTTN